MRGHTPGRAERALIFIFNKINSISFFLLNLSQSWHVPCPSPARRRCGKPLDSFDPGGGSRCPFPETLARLVRRCAVRTGTFSLCALGCLVLLAGPGAGQTFFEEVTREIGVPLLPAGAWPLQITITMAGQTCFLQRTSDSAGGSRSCTTRAMAGSKIEPPPCTGHVPNEKTRRGWWGDLWRLRQRWGCGSICPGGRVQ
jgi:hypothetical protein